MTISRVPPCSALGFLLILPLPAYSADQLAIWLGGSGNWSDSTKWTSHPLYPDNQIDSTTFDVAIGNSAHDAQILLDHDVIVDTIVFTNGQLGGRNNLTIVEEGSRWTGGTMGGPGTTVVSERATLELTPGSLLGFGRGSTVLARPFINQGHVSSTSATIRVNSSGVISNERIATFEASGGLRIDGRGVINNAGTFRSQDSSTNVDVTFNNSGMVDVQSGTLDLSVGKATGRFDIAPGATLILRGHTLDGARFFNEGAVQLHNTFTRVTSVASELSLHGSVTLEGDLNVNADLRVDDLLWSRGTLRGDGQLIVEPDGGLQFGACRALCTRARPTLDGSHVVNRGTTQLISARQMLATNGAKFTNSDSGVFLLKDDIDLIRDTGRSTFTNQGLFEKSGGDGAAKVQWQFTNSGTIDLRRGTLDFQGGISQSGGEINLIGGDLAVSVGELYLHGGMLQGSGTVAGRVANLAGTVAPGDNGRRITVHGDYRQGEDASFSVDVEGPAAIPNSDRLDVIGLAAIDGFLEIDVADGFIPVLGARYEVLTATDGIDGVFSEDKLTRIAPSLGWDVNYEANRVFVTVTELEPPGWTNVDNPFDVNGDAFVSPIDVLHVINELNDRQYSGDDGTLLDPALFPDHGFLDVTSDGFVSSRDALLVIIEINNASAPEVASVPEPSTYWILLVSAPVVFSYRSRPPFR